MAASSGVDCVKWADDIVSYQWQAPKLKSYRKRHCNICKHRIIVQRINITYREETGDLNGGFEQIYLNNSGNVFPLSQIYWPISTCEQRLWLETDKILPVWTDTAEVTEQIKSPDKRVKTILIQWRPQIIKRRMTMIRCHSAIWTCDVKKKNK